jgi:carbonic anhydrase/acetyltransferase-like protein (isoleucine patch superfamily)
MTSPSEVLVRSASSSAEPALADISSARRLLVRILVPVYLVVLHGVPLGLAAAVVVANGSLVMRGVSIAIASVVYIVTLPLLAGLMCRFTIGAVVAGRFPRDVGHRVYGPRRLYALCWTTVYYHPLAYHVVLALPWLKHLTFRLFGYTGATDFTVYPDTWIRDLPLLTVGSGAYLSNKATISPNMCLHDGSILVRRVTIGAGTLVGHGAMVAPGVVIGAQCEIGVSTQLAIDVRIDAGARVGHCCSIDRSVVIGSRSRLRERTDVGAHAVIGAKISTVFGLIVPARATVDGQCDVNELARAQGIAPPTSRRRTEPNHREAESE